MLKHKRLVKIAGAACIGAIAAFSWLVPSHPSPLPDVFKRALALAPGAKGLAAGDLRQALGGPNALSHAWEALARSAPKAATSSHSANAQQDDNYDLSAHQTLSRVILLIRENYVEPERIKPYDMFVAALDYMQRTVPEVMVDDTLAPAQITVFVGAQSQSFELSGLDQLWEVTMALRDIFRFLQTKITDTTVRRDIEYAAINGMLSTLDPHSVLLKPESFDEVKLSTKGEFGGLGIVISLRDGALTVISPIEGTPASQAGIRAKDKIVKIGEESTVSMGLDEAVQRLRGKPNTKVVVWIQRKGWTEAKKIVINRAIIKIESVTSELLDAGVGYIKIKSFQGNTYDDLQAHLSKLKDKNNGHTLTGLILDLRNNPGGLLDQAILVSDRFIEQGPLVITVGEGARKREVKHAHPGPDENAYPMAILLNGGSASASEIVSGALKNHNRAFVVGQQSFGKGSVQVLYDFKDRSALKLTIAQYLTPGDLSIQSVGVVPDVAVLPAVIEKEAVHLFVDDDNLREKDLEKHLEQHGVTSLTHSTIKVFHLSDKERDELDPDIATQTIDDISGHGKLADDFEVKLAHDVLKAAKSTQRETLLAQALPLLSARAQEQDDIIAKRMGELGVSWQRDPSQPLAQGSGPAGAQPTLAQKDVPNHVVIGLVAEGEGGVIMGGGNVVLRGRVHNAGKEPLYRVWGATQSDNPIFKGLEFVFGYVAPNAYRDWEVKIKLPADMPARADWVTLRLGDQANLTGDANGSCAISIEARQKPNFAFETFVDDVSGNNDGMLQPGEHVALNVNVTNVGPGTADEVVVVLKNLSGRQVFLDAGRQKLGAMRPNETLRAVLPFALLQLGGAADSTGRNDDGGQDDKSEVVAAPFVDGAQMNQGANANAQNVPSHIELRLGVYDGLLGAGSQQTIRLPIAPHRRGKTEARTYQVRGPHDVPVFAGASDSLVPIAHLRPETRVESTTSFIGYIKVVAPIEGFVRTADVVAFKKAQALKKRGNKKEAQKLEVVRTPPIAAPDIALALPSLIVDEEVVHLRGHVTDPRRLLDMVVFIGDKKVYYRDLSKEVSHNNLTRYTFDVPLKLKMGSNQVAVVVREDTELMARKFFGLLRRAPAAKAP